MVLAWLLLGMPVPSKDMTTGPMGLMNSLGEYLTPTALLGVVSFAAYVTGIVLALDSNQATHIMGLISRIRYGSINGFNFRNLDELESSQQKYEEDEFIRSIKTTTRQVNTLVNDSLRKVYKQIELSDRLDTSLEKELQRAYTKAAQGLENEIPVLGTKLLEKNKDLYAVVDRTRSEADFRLGISIPLLAIAVQQAVSSFSSGAVLHGSMVLASGVLISGILLRKGWNKGRETNGTILSMVQINVIQSDVLRELEDMYTPTIEAKQL